MKPPKITLAEAREGGAEGLDLDCETPRPGGLLCRHTGRVALRPLIARFGVSIRIDTLPFVCARCGGREIDVRPWFGDRTVGGLPVRA